MLISIHFCELNDRLICVTFRNEKGRYYAQDEVNDRVLTEGRALADLKTQLEALGARKFKAIHALDIG